MRVGFDRMDYINAMNQKDSFLLIILVEVGRGKRSKVERREMGSGGMWRR